MNPFENVETAGKVGTGKIEIETGGIEIEETGQEMIGEIETARIVRNAQNEGIDQIDQHGQIGKKEKNGQNVENGYRLEKRKMLSLKKNGINSRLAKAKPGII